MLWIVIVLHGWVAVGTGRRWHDVCCTSVRETSRESQKCHVSRGTGIGRTGRHLRRSPRSFMFQRNPRSTDRFIRAQRLPPFPALRFPHRWRFGRRVPGSRRRAMRRARRRRAPPGPAGCRWNILPVLDVRSDAPPSAPIRRAPPGPAAGARAGQRRQKRGAGRAPGAAAARAGRRRYFAALHPLLPGHTVHSSIYSRVNKDLSSGHLLVHTAPPGSHSEARGVTGLSLSNSPLRILGTSLRLSPRWIGRLRVVSDCPHSHQTVC